MLIWKKGLFILLLVSVFIFNGCKSSVDNDFKVAFKNFYNSSDAGASVSFSESERIVTHDIIANETPVPAFFNYIARAYKISVIFDPSIAGRSVTLNLYESTLDNLLSAVSRLLGSSVVKIGDVYYVGTIKPEDRAYFVTVVPRLNKAEIDELFGSILGENGRYSSFPDGLIVVVDVQEVLQRVSDMLKLVSQAPNDSWVIQLSIFSFRGSAGQSLGLDTNFSGSLSYELLKNPGSSFDRNFSTNGLLSGLFEAEKESSDISLLSQPLFVLLDGGQASFVYGDKVPIAKKSVSNEGTVTTTGYEYVQTGLNYNVNIRQLNDDMAKLGISLSLSSVVGYVGDAPITDQQDFETVANINSYGVYLLGSVQREQKKSVISGILPFSFSDSSDGSEIQIWARVYKIDGSALPL